jgi:hypothetical protein
MSDLIRLSQNALFAVLGWLLACSQAWAVTPLVAETTQFRETGRYDEVERRCLEWPRLYPAWVRCETVGHTAEGRAIRALVASKGTPLQPASHKSHPVVLVIGGTHAGEIDGKDAGLILLRQLLASSAASNPLRHLTLVFVPVFNVDGHENRGRHLRPNQNGPLEVGDRTTSQRINLNRDWMLAQTPEMRAMLALVRRWDPDVTLDLHVTDGIRYRHDVAISQSTLFNQDGDMQTVSDFLLQNIMARLQRRGHAPLDFYPVFNDPEDPTLGMIQEVDSPRFSHIYATLRNRLGFLVEDHAWDDYATRVRTCMATLLASLESVAEHRDTLMRTLVDADRKSARLGGRTVPLAWYNTADIGPAQPSGQLVLQGYRYEVHEHAPVSGGRGISYDVSQPMAWPVPLFNHLRPVPEAMQALPQAGYLIPAGWAQMVRPYLQWHGVHHEVLSRPLRQVAVQAMRLQEKDVVFEARPFQGRVRTQLNGHWTHETIDLARGALYIPMEQPHGLLAAHLLEPWAPDSLSSWGVFNTAYELSDYIAGHRELELARWMVTQHPRIQALFGDQIFEQLPAWRRAFEERLQQDRAFAADPQARLDFWMSKLPPYDPGYNLYPVLRTATPPR